MSFLERQESARRRTLFYRVQLGLLAIPCMASMLVATLFSVWLAATAILGKVLSWFVGEDPAYDMLTTPTAVVVAVVIYTILTFWYLVASKTRQLRRSGEHVAKQLDARPVTRASLAPGERRLHNVIQEMALAAGVPPPSVYVWPEESMINALAVGHTTSDAALFVTRRAVDALTRDETQALVGYGMSQILNGDMALNARLAAYIYAFKFAPRVARWWLYLPEGQKGLDFVKALMAWFFFALWIGLFLTIIAFPQYLGARLLQAGIGRERQKLADASALQFTRNADGVSGALAKTLALGTTPAKPAAVLDDLAHACYASPVRRRWFDTHVPLDRRLLTVSPRFDLRSIPELRAKLELQALERQARADEERAREEQGAAAGAARREFIERVTTAAVVAQAAVSSAEASASSAPGVAPASASASPSAPTPASAPRPGIATPAVSPPPLAADDGRVAILALLLDRKPEVQARQLAVVGRHFGDASPAVVRAALASAGPMIPAERSLALDATLPALRALPAPELRRMAQAVRDLEAADEHVDVFEYALSRQTVVFAQDLLDPRDPHGGHALDAHAEELSVVFSVLAHCGGERSAAPAYDAGMQRLGLRSWPRMRRIASWVQAMDAALAALERLRPIAKELLLEALGATVRFDRHETPAEREVLRVIASSLHCPMPR